VDSRADRRSEDPEAVGGQSKDGLARQCEREPLIAFDTTGNDDITVALRWTRSPLLSSHAPGTSSSNWATARPSEGGRPRRSPWLTAGDAPELGANFDPQAAEPATEDGRSSVLGLERP